MMNIFVPFSVSIQPYVEAIREKEEVLENNARMATMERIMGMNNCLNVFFFIYLLKQVLIFL